MRVFFAAVTLALLYVAPAAGQGFDPTPQTRLVPLGTNDPAFRLVAKETTTGFYDPERLKARWNIVPDAEHHKAAVRVINGGGDGAGSGVMIQHDGEGVVVLTNHHVMSRGWTGNGFRDDCYGTATVVGSGGTQTFRLLTADPGIDVAVLYTENATTTHAVPIASQMPPADAVLEYVGFGGPTSGKRAFTAKRINSRDPISLDAATVSGDSGGPILYGGTLVGINYGAPSHAGSAGTHEGWAVTHPMSSKATPETLTQILRGCGIRCTPRQPQIIFEQPAPIPTPQPIQPQPPTAQPTPPQPTQGLTQQQLDELAKDVASQLKNDPAMRGEPGKDGTNGVDGRDGMDGRDGIDGSSATADQIASAVAYFIASNPELIAAEIQPHLDPIYPRWIDKDGKTIDEVPGGIRLGQVMQLRQDIVTRLVEKNAGTKSE